MCMPIHRASYLQLLICDLVIITMNEVRELKIVDNKMLVKKYLKYCASSDVGCFYFRIFFLLTKSIVTFNVLEPSNKNVP